MCASECCKNYLTLALDICYCSEVNLKVGICSNKSLTNNLLAVEKRILSKIKDELNSCGISYLIENTKNSGRKNKPVWLCTLYCKIIVKDGGSKNATHISVGNLHSSFEISKDIMKKILKSNKLKIVRTNFTIFNCSNNS